MRRRKAANEKLVTKNGRAKGKKEREGGQGLRSFPSFKGKKKGMKKVCGRACHQKSGKKGLGDFDKKEGKGQRAFPQRGIGVDGHFDGRGKAKRFWRKGAEGSGASKKTHGRKKGEGDA